MFVCIQSQSMHRNLNRIWSMVLLLSLSITLSCEAKVLEQISASLLASQGHWNLMFTSSTLWVGQYVYLQKMWFKKVASTLRITSRPWRKLSPPRKCIAVFKAMRIWMKHWAYARKLWTWPRFWLADQSSSRLPNLWPGRRVWLTRSSKYPEVHALSYFNFVTKLSFWYKLWWQSKVMPEKKNWTWLRWFKLWHIYLAWLNHLLQM